MSTHTAEVSATDDDEPTPLYDTLVTDLGIDPGRLSSEMDAEFTAIRALLPPPSPPAPTPSRPPITRPIRKVTP